MKKERSRDDFNIFPLELGFLAKNKLHEINFSILKLCRICDIAHFDIVLLMALDENVIRRFLAYDDKVTVKNASSVSEEVFMAFKLS